MIHEASDQPLTVWDVIAPQLPQKAETPLRFIARALGFSVSEVQGLLRLPPTAERLLELNRLSQYRHLALANRVWPNCTWFDYRLDRKALHPALEIITNTLGRYLLDYIAKRYGEDTVQDYWYDLEIPPQYDDLVVDPDADDPLRDIPEEQFVFNWHIPDEEDGEFFVFGSRLAAECFRWLIQNRQNYAHFVYNATSYVNDPLGIQLAYDLRETLREEYWATLPPDTLPTYLAIVRALQTATVPESFREGSLPELNIIKVATLETDSLDIVQADWDELTWAKRDRLTFNGQPVHIFVLDPDTDMSPAAMILTTNPEPGSPEKHSKSLQFHYLTESDETMTLAFVPRVQAKKDFDLEEIDHIFEEALWERSFALHEQTQVFCISRMNPYWAEGAYGPIKVYRLADGYMLQFNPEYSFVPREMHVAAE